MSNTATYFFIKKPFFYLKIRWFLEYLSNTDIEKSY
jgi:hypothetical protein